MAGLLSPRSGGLLASPRQVRMPAPMPQGAPSPFMGMMGGMEGQGAGMDPRDAPGTSVSIWRELMRGLSQHGMGALAPGMAGQIFSGPNRAMLGPAYQRKGK